MAKQLNVNLAFTADTSQAKSQLNDLQMSLSKLTQSAATNTGELGLNKELTKSISKVTQLQALLEKSKNSTGGLDLNKFTTGLQQSKTSINDYAKALSSLGPQGEQAFAKFARSVSTAQVPLKQANGLLTQFGTTLKNTARWQISSSVLHGFIGSIQSAFGYAQSLNKSLTDIRIVTGQSTEQMAAFAEKANKAAQALSSTTTKYTDAALIYYQQGLSDDEVQKRTDATIKMANVTGEAVKDVSSYMTAVWNNFNKDGQYAEEHFADIMTKLGAETAASTAEIADGLSKFSAVADTIGLSFEMASSSVTAIVDQTREAPEVVGTALKTIFSRIEGLSLGETLEDGTDLNKYSKGLQKVGVDIKDAAGNMKDADTILKEIGAVWDTLEKDQQIALSQTVAGVRQYNQFMALFDNWGKVEENLNMASTADGTLDEQAEAYAESWEAAKNRVKSAFEEIYSQLLNDKFFIELNNGFAGFLNTVSNTIDTMGGLPGVLSLVSGLMFKIFGPDMIASIDRWGQNIKLRSEEGFNAMLKQRQDVNNGLRNMYRDSADPTGGLRADVYTKQADVQDTLLLKQQELIANGTKLTEQDERQVQAMMDLNEQLGQAVIKTGEELAAQEKIADNLARQISIKATKSQKEVYGALDNAEKSELGRVNGKNSTLKEDIQAAKQAQQEFGALDAIYQKIGKSGNLDEIKTDLLAMKDAAVKAGMDTSYLDQILAEFKDDTLTFEKLRNAIYDLSETAGGKAQNMFSEIAHKAQQAGMDMSKINPILEQMQSSFAETGAVSDTLIQKLKDLGLYAQETNTFIKGLQGPPPTAAQGFVAFGQQISNVAMAMSSLKGLFDTWNNEDMTIGEKTLSTLTTLGMIIPMITMSWNKNTAAELAAFSASIKNNAAKLLLAAGLKGEAIAAAAASGGLASEAAASLMAATGTETFGAALWTLLWPIGLLMLALGALIGTIALVVKVFKDIEAASPAGQLRAAEEEAKALTDALNDAKTKANELKSTFDNYDSLVEKLNSCTRGTEEWNAALREVNDATADILQKYPELLSMENLFDEDGVINQDVIDDMVEKADSAVQTANAAALMGQAEVQVKKGEASKDYLTSQDNASVFGMGVLGAAAMGSPLAGVGMALATGVINEIDDAIQGGKIDKVVDNYASMGEAALSSANIAKTLGIDLDSATEAQLEYVESVRETARELVDGATAMRNAAKTTVDEWAQSQELELNGAESAMLTNEYQDSYESIKQQILNDDAAKNSQGNKDDQAGIWARYQKATGQDLELARNGIRGSDDNRTYAYLENGEEKEVSIETIASTIAAAEALEQLGESATSVSEFLSDMSATGVEFAEAMANGRQEDGTVELNDYLDDFTQADLDIFASGKQEDVLKALDMTEEQFTSLADKYGLSTEELLNQLVKDAGEVSASITEEEKELLNNLGEGAKELSIQQQKEFGENQTAAKDNLKDSNITIGQHGGISLADLEKENSDNAENLSKFYKELGNINLESENAAEQIEALKEEYEIQGTTVDKLIGKVEKLNHTYSIGTEDINTEKKELSDIVGEDGLSEGDTVEQEDIDKLKEAGVDVDTYFTQMSDGTYKLTGDAQAFAEVVDKITLDKLLDQANDFVENRNKIAEGKEYDVKNLTNSDNHDQNVAKGQIDYLKNFEDMDFSNIEGADKILDIDTNKEGLELTKEELKIINQMIDEVNSKEIDIQTQALTEADNVDELQGIAGSFEGGVNSQAYGEALIGLGSQYDNCTQEVTELQQAMMSGDEEMIRAATTALELSTRIGELSEKYDLDAEDVETHARLIKENAEGMELSEEQAANLAVANRRMNKGIKTLNENWKDWSKTLKKGDKNSADYADTLNDANDALADLVGAVDGSKVPMKFFDKNTKSGAKHLELMEKAANGDTDAINQLGVALASAQVEAMEFNESMANAAIEDGKLAKGFDLTDFNNYKAEVMEGINALQEAIQNGTVSAGDNINQLMNGTGQSWVESLNAMAMATGMGVNEMNALLSELGVTAEVNTTTVKQEMEVPTYIDRVEPSEPVQIENGVNADGSTKYATVRGYKRYTIPGPPKKVKGYVQVAQIGTVEGGGAAPAKLTYTGTNGGSVGGGVSPSSTGGGKSGGGKGGGNTKKDKKKKSDEIERYHEITNSLDDMSKALDRVGKAKDRAWGKDKMKAIKDEIDLLDQEIGLQEQYLDEINTNYKKDKNALNKYGVKFDAEGNISNYDEVMGEQIDIFNSKRTEAAEKAYNNFKEAVEQYEETHDLWIDENDAYQDMLDEKYDKLTELATAEFEITMEIDAQTQEYLDWLIGQSEDDIFQAADRIANINLSSQSTANANNSENGGEELIRDILENDNHNLSQKTIKGFLNNEDWAVKRVSQETFTADEIEQLEEGAAAMREAAAKLREDEAAIHEELSNIISETTDQMDRQIDIIDTLTDMIQTYVDIVDVVGKKVLKISNSDIKNLERSSLEGSRAALRSSKEEYETLKTERETLYAEYKRIEATLDETSKARWRERLQEVDDAMLEAQSDYTSRWQETLEKAAEIFENEVTRTLEEFNETMTGAFKGSLEELQDAFDQQQEISQLYVQDYKKIYELSKLTRDISTSIDKTDNLEATRELADLQKTIAEYEEAGVQMSQYEIDHLRKKYELKLAEIALEESQNAKSQVRMQRDSEGNYGYVYTANEEDVAAAEQSYEDKLYEMQELNGEYINELQSNILQLQQDLAEELANVNRADFENTEEYTAKLEEIKARYYEKMGFYTSQMNTALDNQSDVYENDWAKYSEATGYKISANEDFVDSWDETTLAVLTGFESIQDYAKTFYDSLDTTLGDLSGAFDQWYKDVDGIMEDAGSSIETFGEDVEKTVGNNKDGLIKDINDAENAVSELRTAFEQLMNTSSEKATTWYNSWNKKMQDLAKQAGLTSKAIVRLLETGKDDDDKDDKDDDPPKNDPPKNDPPKNNTPTFKVGGKFKVGKNTSIYDYAGDTSPEHQYYDHDPVYTLLKTKKVNGKTWLQGRYHKLNHGVSGWFKKSQATALDTGGYTGDWGTSDGRWALLHQKEIVLNKEDTENFLKAVDIVRDLSSKIDLNASLSQNGIGAMTAAGIKEHNQTLEQQVSIQASFPNATNHSEIEQAFENLVNMAAQYANRK